MFEAFRSRCSLRLGAAAIAGVLAMFASSSASSSDSAASAASWPTSPAGWRAAARADIETAVQLTRDNHPGPVDPHNPGFSANLDAARAHALALADKVVDAAGYAAALQGFNARIKDGHAGMFPRLDKDSAPTPRWPGFIAVWRGDALYVHSSQSGQPPVGSKLLSCDGKPARQLIVDNVFSFGNRVDEAGQWWLAARRVFIDDRNPFITLPQRCRFEANGKPFEQVLAWQPVDDGLKMRFAESSWGATRPVGVTEPRKNLFWVSMPTFQPNEAERAAYRTIAADLTAQRARWLGLDAVVIDLRKNQGGSSDWSYRFAEALWGKARVTAADAAADKGVETWWRASPGNADYVAESAAEFVEKGDPEGAARWRRYAAGMRAALAQGKPFYVQQADAAAVQAAPAPVADAVADGPAFTKPVYVIVPGNCASACLDALDVFTLFPNTVLVGAPSSADSTYMEVRYVELDSGRATVIVPNKVYVNRKRANGQFYTPQIEVRDVVWSEPVLLKAVEADLAQRAR